MPRFLNKTNVDQVTAEDIEDYPLPYDPEIVVRIRSVSLGRMRQYFESSEKGGTVARKALYALIAESVVDESGQPVFDTPDTVEGVGKAKTRFVNAVQKMIELHNGGKDKLTVEEAEKNSDATI